MLKNIKSLLVIFSLFCAEELPAKVVLSATNTSAVQRNEVVAFDAADVMKRLGTASLSQIVVKDSYNLLPISSLTTESCLSKPVCVLMGWRILWWSRALSSSFAVMSTDISHTGVPMISLGRTTFVPTVPMVLPFSVAERRRLGLTYG